MICDFSQSRATPVFLAASATAFATAVFRGTFDVRASDINEEMKVAAAHALAELISDEELSADYIIPKAFDRRVGPAA